MRQAVPPFLPLFRSEMQLRLFGLLLESDREWSIDNLVRALGAPRPSVHRELQRAVRAGLLERDATRRPHTFTAATDSPLYEPLRRLLEMTVGVEARLRDYFAENEDVEAAAIFGSWARGEARGGSDIDVLVVGSPDITRLRRDVRRIGQHSGREIDPVVFSSEEFDGRKANKDGFVKKILKEPRVVLTGELDGRGP